MPLKRVTSIDFGSTNSQIAQCYQQSSDGKVWTIAMQHKNIQDYLLQVQGEYNIPTIIVTPNDVPEDIRNTINFGDEGGLFGFAAASIFYKYKGIKPRIEFKKDFFCSGEDLSDPDRRKKFDEACESIELLLRFMKNITNNAQKYFTNQQVPDETIITVPVRATATERDTMRELAENAGWTNIVILDEARAALRYALGAQNSPLLQKIEQLTVHQKLNVLITDIGGSTTDILLVEIKPDGQGSFKVNILGQWPEIGEEHTLGGIEIDKKLCEWFLEKQYLLPHLVEEDIESHGYFAFRQFKEDSTKALHNNKPALMGDKINNLKVDLENLENFTAAKFQYPKNGEINASTFLYEIAGDYLKDLREAIGKVLSNCKVKEEDIDCILASGGGAQIFGISELLKGEPLPTVDKDHALQFKKIQADPSRYIENKEISSALCAMGSALPLPQIRFKNSSPCEYFYTLNIYRTASGMAEGWDEIFYSPPNIPNHFTKTALSDIKCVFAPKNVPLPHEEKKHYFEPRVHTKDGDVFVYVISVFSHSEEKGTHFQKAWSSFSRRTLGRFIKDQLPGKKHRFVPATVDVEIKIGDNLSIEINPSINIDGQWLFVLVNRQTNN